jgi:hypothetical protein
MANGWINVGENDTRLNLNNVVFWERHTEGTILTAVGVSVETLINVQFDEFDKAMKDWLSPKIIDVASSCACKADSRTLEEIKKDGLEEINGTRRAALL